MLFYRSSSRRQDRSDQRSRQGHHLHPAAADQSQCSAAGRGKRAVPPADHAQRHALGKTAGFGLSRRIPERSRARLLQSLSLPWLPAPPSRSPTSPPSFPPLPPP